MAAIEPFCRNPRCTGFPAFFAVEALLTMNRCPNCASKLRFRCSGCGYMYPEAPGMLQWCAFCGTQFDRAQSA